MGLHSKIMSLRFIYMYYKTCKKYFNLTQAHLNTQAQTQHTDNKCFELGSVFI